jgi:hypothetical protein
VQRLIFARFARARVCLAGEIMPIHQLATLIRHKIPFDECKRDFFTDSRIRANPLNGYVHPKKN